MILLQRTEVAFKLGCFLLASYMTITQIFRYLENRDASSIRYKQFNQSPRDIYPTFTICFEGPELRWYYDSLIYDSLGISSAQYQQLLKGETVVRYDYEYTTQLYTKTSLDIRNVSTTDFERFSLNLSDLLNGLEFVTQEPTSSIHYGNSKEGRLVQELPFFIGYETAEKICFTRKSNDDLESIRLHDYLAFQKSTFLNHMYGRSELQIIIHYPGQLLRSFDNPSFKSTFIDYDTCKDLDLDISQVTILRKRHDSNVPCNKEVQDDVDQLQRDVIKRLECIPIYWKRIAPKDLKFDDCTSPTELKKAYDYTNNYKTSLSLHEAPCVDMKVLVMYHKEIREADRYCDAGNLVINFLYKGTHYQEIENVRDFGFESFWSGVGGFVGIFLGYSIMQFPELIHNTPFLFGKLKNALFGV